MLETVLLAVTAFASTNIDDAFVLLAFFGDGRFRSRDVIIGQYLGMATLTLAAIVFGLLAFAIPARYVGLMGILPILIGSLRLWQVWRAQTGDDQEVKDVKKGLWGGTETVALVTIANGGDNIAAYVPMFARAPTIKLALICAIFAVMVAAWCLAAQFLIRHRLLSAWVQTWGRRVTPFVLIGLGAYILLRSGSVHPS